MFTLFIYSFIYLFIYLFVCFITHKLKEEKRESPRRNHGAHRIRLTHYSTGKNDIEIVRRFITTFCLLSEGSKVIIQCLKKTASLLQLRKKNCFAVEEFFPFRQVVLTVN